MQSTLPARLAAIGLALFGAVIVTPAAQAALVGVNPVTPSGTDYQAFYDTTQNITWLANADLAKSNKFSVTGINADGSMDWATANNWIAAMNAATYLGVNNWRLPATAQVDPTCTIQQTRGGVPIASGGKRCTGSEMGHLYWVDSVVPKTAGLPFSNLQIWYWSGTVDSASSIPPSPWTFLFDDGSQSPQTPDSTGPYAWAVAPGNPFNAVPLPGAAWLFGSALGVLGLRRRKR